MSDHYKVGDEVEVYNGITTRIGTVVAILHGYQADGCPVVVQHAVFGKNITREKQAFEKQIYQCFTHEGTQPGQSPVKIRRAKEYRILPICGNPLYASGSWRTEENGRNFIKINKNTKGFLRGEYNPVTDKISDIVYTTLEG